MKEFKVVFNTGTESKAVGTKIYSDDSKYYIESYGFTCEYNKSDVKCISPVDDK